MSSVQILVGDCRAVLKTLKDQSVQTVVTSPPYFALRDYGVDGQIGLEASPAEFVTIMVDVFHEARRVLRDDGTLWLNLGDSYSGARSGPEGGRSTLGGSRASQNEAKKARAVTESRRRDRVDVPRSDLKVEGLPPKNLIGMPWRVALALQDDGWILRRDIIWHKANPQPEAVNDRCTTAHEYLFHFAKSGRPTIWRARDTMDWAYEPDLTQRLPDPTEDEPDRTVPRWRAFDYYYDAEAIKEDASPNTHPRVAKAKLGQPVELNTPKGQHNAPGARQNASFQNATSVNVLEKRNKRSVWTVSTEPFKGAHFATFPPSLIEPCILAGSPAGAVVLDPFGGAGTTGLVAQRLQRRAILIELNPDYAEMAAERLRAQMPLMADVRVA